MAVVGNGNGTDTYAVLGSQTDWDSPTLWWPVGSATRCIPTLSLGHRQSNNLACPIFIRVEGRDLPGKHKNHADALKSKNVVSRKKLQLRRSNKFSSDFDGKYLSRQFQQKKTKVDILSNKTS